MSEIKNLSKLMNIYYRKKDSPFIANWDITRELKNYDFKVGIVSNGLLLNSLSKEKIEFMNKYLDTLVVSIDSSVSEEHNKFRNTPMLFELIMKGITKLQLHGFKNITFESIIMGSNYKRIPSLIELTKEIYVRKIIFVLFPLHMLL